jgi:acetyltransferase-like isoleucine patch superfamily enzyme
MWLAYQRRSGIFIEPSIRVQGELSNLRARLFLGKGAYLDHGVILWLGDKDGSIRLAERVYTGPYVFLGTYNHKLLIGEDTMIGAHCYIVTENHGTQRIDIPFSQQRYSGADVMIGRNVWLGCHVTVLPGVTIGDHAIIGAGAVVTHSVPAGERWVGVPARRINSK